MQINTDKIPFTSIHAPWWAVSGHIHTIVPSLFDLTVTPATERITISTPDDDFLDIDTKINPDSDVALIVLHGLEGSSRRYYITELLQEADCKGWNLFALNFRGCSGRMNKQPRFYHSGETGDLKHLIAWIQKKYPSKKLLLAGFSLGGNVIQRYLGEEPENPIHAAAAISAPYDMKACSLALMEGFNKTYQTYFLRQLKQKLETKRIQHPELPDFAGNTLYDFDDQVTAPLHGFSDAEDYYERCSGDRVLCDIKTQLLLVHAQKDPICPFDVLPTAIIRSNPYIQTLFTHNGGHVGFITRPEELIQKRVVSYLSSNI